MGLWHRVVGVYRIEDVGGIELLAQACAGEDRAEMLAEAIERDGAVVYSRSGVPRTHPAIKDEITCRAFAELEVAKRNPGQREGSRRPALAGSPSAFSRRKGMFERFEGMVAPLNAARCPYQDLGL